MDFLLTSTNKICKTNSSSSEDSDSYFLNLDTDLDNYKCFEDVTHAGWEPISLQPPVKSDNSIISVSEDDSSESLGLLSEEQLESAWNDVTEELFPNLDIKKFNPQPLTTSRPPQNFKNGILWEGDSNLNSKWEKMEISPIANEKKCFPIGFTTLESTPKIQQIIQKSSRYEENILNKTLKINSMYENEPKEASYSSVTSDDELNSKNNSSNIDCDFKKQDVNDKNCLNKTFQTLNKTLKINSVSEDVPKKASYSSVKSGEELNSINNSSNVNCNFEKQTENDKNCLNKTFQTLNRTLKINSVNEDVPKEASYSSVKSDEELNSKNNSSNITCDFERNVENNENCLNKTFQTLNILNKTLPLVIDTDNNLSSEENSKEIEKEIVLNKTLPDNPKDSMNKISYTCHHENHELPVEAKDSQEMLSRTVTKMTLPSVTCTDYNLSCEEYLNEIQKGIGLNTTYLDNPKDSMNKIYTYDHEKLELPVEAKNSQEMLSHTFTKITLPSVTNTDYNLSFEEHLQEIETGTLQSTTLSESSKDCMNKTTSDAYELKNHELLVDAKFSQGILSQTVTKIKCKKTGKIHRSRENNPRLNLSLLESSTFYRTTASDSISQTDVLRTVTKKKSSITDGLKKDFFPSFESDFSKTKTDLLKTHNLKKKTNILSQTNRDLKVLGSCSVLDNYNSKRSVIHPQIPPLNRTISRGNFTSKSIFPKKAPINLSFQKTKEPQSHKEKDKLCLEEIPSKNEDFPRKSFEETSQLKENPDLKLSQYCQMKEMEKKKNKLELLAVPTQRLMPIADKMESRQQNFISRLPQKGEPSRIGRPQYRPLGRSAARESEPPLLPRICGRSAAREAEPSLLPRISAQRRSTGGGSSRIPTFGQRGTSDITKKTLSAPYKPL